MSALHMLYQTRWAVRNDPALGWVLLYAMCWRLAWHRAAQDVYRTIHERMIVALITMDSTHPAK